MKNTLEILIRSAFSLAFIMAIMTVGGDPEASLALTAGGNLYVGDSMAQLDRFVSFLRSPASRNFVDTQYFTKDPNTNAYRSLITNPLITEEEVRMEAKLEPGKSTIKFYPNEKSNDRYTEKKIETNCTFMPTHLSLVIQKENLETTGDGHTDGITCIEYNVMFPYSDPAYHNFTGADGTKEYQELQAIFNSCISLSTGKTERMSNFPLHKGEYRPVSQFLPAAASPSGAAMFPTYGPSLGERGYRALRIPFPLFGGVDNVFCIDLNKGMGQGVIGGPNECGVDSCNVAVLKLCGLKFSGNVSDGCFLN